MEDPSNPDMDGDPVADGDSGVNCDSLLSREILKSIGVLGPEQIDLRDDVGSTLGETERGVLAALGLTYDEKRGGILKAGSR